MMKVLTVQFDDYLSIRFGNSAIRCVLNNIRRIYEHCRDVFSENIT